MSIETQEIYNMGEEIHFEEDNICNNEPAFIQEYSSGDTFNYEALIFGPPQNEKKDQSEGISSLEKQPTNNSSSVKQLESINLIPDPVTDKKKETAFNFLGRKLKGDKSERKHNKFGEDNMMNKVKTYYLKFVQDQANSTLSPGHDKFCKISKEVSSNLQKDFNIVLMNKKIGDIFSEYSINGRYSKSQYDKNYNSKLVARIMRDNKEKSTIEFLNKTYKEVLDIMVKNHLKKFKEDILIKEIKNGEKKEDAEKYVNDLVELLQNYESWFKEKSGRRRKQDI